MFPSLPHSVTLLCLASLQWSLLPVVNGQNTDTPSDSNFIRRGYERATVLSNFLYLSGGELSQYSSSDSGSGRTLPPDNRPSNPISSVLSLSLSTSWLARTASFRSTSFGESNRPPVVNNAALWPWTSSIIDGRLRKEGFYVYGGQVSWDSSVQDLAKEGIWKFTTDGLGGGSWELEDASNSEVLSGLNLAASMAFAAGAGRGWSIGGIITKGTDPDVNITGGGVRVPGMVEYEFETKKWTNYTEVGFLKSNEALEGGRAQFVDFPLGLDENKEGGMVMVFGGGVYSLPVTRKGDSRGIVRPDWLLDFQNLTFFDADTKKWYSQMTTGTPPIGRMGHCVAGVRSRAGTYEIFVYGGADAGFTESYDDLYVLSLPGFVWFRVNERSNGVHSHGTCAVVGNHQLLVIGGQNEKDGWPGIWQTKDPLPLGLGIFDMTAMAWKSNGSYDAEAAEYRPAEVIEQWYKDGGLDKVEWDSDDVKKMFLATPVNFEEADEPSSSDKPSSGGSGSSDGNGSSDDNTGKSKGDSKSNTGAVAGGIVGGCVVVLGVIGGWLFWRRKNKKTSAEAAPSVEDPVQEQESSHQPLPGPYQQPYEEKKELPIQSPAVEVYVPPVELPSNPYNRWELHSDVRPNELQGDAPLRQELPEEGRP